MDIRIRTAGIDDLDHLLHHRRAMFEEIGFRDPAVLDRVDRFSREYFLEALPAGRYKAWVAEDTNGRVLGGGGIVISSWPGYPSENHPKRLWILNMYTEPEARRHGIAKRLVQAMIDWCGKEGFSSVSLHASDAGRPLYAGLGFHPTNEMTLQLR
jgi:GNAT superfamily N-acetyltransferase